MKREKTDGGNHRTGVKLDDVYRKARYQYSVEQTAKYSVFRGASSLAKKLSLLS